MNNRGQVLVVFIILLPIIIGLGALLIDMGFNRYQVNKLNNLNQMVVSYGLDNIEDDNVYNKMISLMLDNDSKIKEYKLEIKNKKISLTINKTIDSILGKLLKIDNYYLESKYIGYLNDGQKIIEKG